MPLDIPPDNLVVQPYSRGTAHGILLPLLLILYRDPDAVLLVLPSDHHVCNEMMLASSLQQAMQSAREHDCIVLLGLMPEEADPELGYIVCDDESSPGLRAVRQFVEKPSRACARALIFNGGLWNSFIFAASGKTLLRAFELRCAQTVANLRHILERSTDPVQRRRRLTDLYKEMPQLDFSRDILQAHTVRLSVLAVPSCGWSDLGTPRHVAQALHRSTLPSAPARGLLDLAARHAELQLPHQEHS